MLSQGNYLHKPFDSAGLVFVGPCRALSGLVERELPLDGRSPDVPLRHTGFDVRGQLVLGGNALVQTLTGDGRAFEFDHVEPGGAFGRVMHLEAGRQRAGLGGGQGLVKDGIGVGVEVVLDQHDFLGLRIGGG